ncbi:hypothetical protein [Paenibacillus sp. NPDC093718]|uniref:hypothetical protein n=1 Tax=Paenibacillus sp. NPDC093718 TaxID=3390601 RepID=UPI003D023983
MVKGRVGRKRLYDDEKTMSALKELVIEFRKRNPAGKITYVKMAEFSKEMHLENSNKYPVIYNRFVWANQARSLIDEINKPIRSYSKHNIENLEIPPIAKYIEEYSNNPKKLLALLLPTEKLIFDLLELLEARTVQISELNYQLDYLNKKNASLQELCNNLSEYVLSIVSLSNEKKFRQQYGLPEILEFNEKSMSGLNDLRNFLYSTEQKKKKNNMSDNMQESKEGAIMLDHWKRIKDTKYTE